MAGAAVEDKRLVPAVILGLGDGAMSILGIVAYGSRHPAVVLPLAASGALSAALSMGANEWLSESGEGFTAGLAMGGATLCGSVLPAWPFAVFPRAVAPLVTLLMLALVAAAVGRMRAGRRHPYAETVGVLAAIAAASVTLALLLPGGTA